MKRLSLTIKFIGSLLVFLALSLRVCAGESVQTMMQYGVSVSTATYLANVSSREGNFTSVNTFGCLGAFQFCPGTYQHYFPGMTTDQILQNPQAQVNAYQQYLSDNWALAQRMGYTSLIGQQVTDPKTGQTTTITESSILSACSFGCGVGSKIYNFVQNGNSCSGPNSTSDGYATSVCGLMVKGAGLDVSGIIGGVFTATVTTTTTITTTTAACSPTVGLGAAIAKMQSAFTQNQMTTSAGVYQNTPFSNKLPCIKAMLTFFSAITTIAGLGKAVVMILESIVVAVLNYACQLVVSMINSVLAQLCIPLPSIPGFGLGSNGTKSCRGLQLIPPLSVAPITTQALFGSVNQTINASIDSYAAQANGAMNNLVNSAASTVSGLISSSNANTASVTPSGSDVTTSPSGSASPIPVTATPLAPLPTGGGSGGPSSSGALPLPPSAADTATAAANEAAAVAAAQAASQADPANNPASATAPNIPVISPAQSPAPSDAKVPPAPADSNNFSGLIPGL